VISRLLWLRRDDKHAGGEAGVAVAKALGEFVALEPAVWLSIDVGRARGAGALQVCDHYIAGVGLAAVGDELVEVFVCGALRDGAWSAWAASRKAIQSLRLRLRSGLRQRGTHPSRKKPRDERGTRRVLLCFFRVAKMHKFWGRRFP
jgi:hypothetical protein